MTANCERCVLLSALRSCAAAFIRLQARRVGDKYSWQLQRLSSPIMECLRRHEEVREDAVVCLELHSLDLDRNLTGTGGPPL